MLYQAALFWEEIGAWELAIDINDSSSFPPILTHNFYSETKHWRVLSLLHVILIIECIKYQFPYEVLNLASLPTSNPCDRSKCVSLHR